MNIAQGRMFDWKSRHDSASLNYPIRAALPRSVPAARFWTPPELVLDQGREGACVGFGWAAEAGASPVRIRRVTNEFARGIYNEARSRWDEWPGEDYEGTSVLAGAKTMQRLGIIGEYRWAFGNDDLKAAVCGIGPGVIGVLYVNSMFEPHPSGLVEVVPDRSNNGHCMCVIGYHPKMRLPGEGWLKRHAVYKVRQSWGLGFGRKGDIYIPEEGMDYLLGKQGEACIPMQRLRPHEAVIAAARFRARPS